MIKDIITYDASLLPRVLTRLFPNEKERKNVEIILNYYTFNEIERVRLGILKISNGDLEQIKRWTDIASHDWRDLLCAAEYPLSSGKFGLREKNPEKHNDFLAKEQDQYENWLKYVLAL